MLRTMLTTLKIELLETSQEQLSSNLIVCKNNLMGAKNSDARSPGRQSKYWTQQDTDAFPSGREDAGSPGRQSKYWTQEDADAFPSGREDSLGFARLLTRGPLNQVLLLHAVLRFGVLLDGFVPVLLLDALLASLAARLLPCILLHMARFSTLSGACNLILPSMPAAKASFQKSWSVDMRDPGRLNTFSRCAVLSALA